MELKVLTVPAKQISPYLLSWLPEDYLSTEYVSNNQNLDEAYLVSAFNSTMLDGKNPEHLYSEIVHILESLKDSENPNFLIKPDQYDEFIYVLFAGETLVNHLHSYYTRENETIKATTQWLMMKIQMAESNGSNLSLYLKRPMWKDESAIVCEDLTAFSKSIDSILCHHYSALRGDYSHINLQSIINEKTSIDELKTVAKQMHTHEDCRQTIIGLMTFLLGKYLNENAQSKLPSSKLNSKITTYHTRFLIPFYELLGWRTFLPDSDALPSSIKYYEKAIKAFRTHLDSVTKT